ncbi:MULTISPECIES: hypothetical protein [unclassified Pseudomonas]|uniref:hypothetical protein n=1 Tax=unclassified Pseudomonas TaxID=196821 RepID=UPI00148314CB|nr:MULTISPECIES: hypothetical protein [unclassified Pseudomonas]
MGASLLAMAAVLAPHGIFKTLRQATIRLARAELHKPTATFFLNKNETGFRGQQQ